MVAATSCGRGGRCAQNPSKSFLNPSYPCFNGVCFFCGCSRLRCCGWGGRCAQNLAKIFFKIFFFFRRFFLFAVAATSCGRRWGALRSKSGKIFFKIFFSFYRRFFLFVVAATSCGRGWGGRYAQNLAKSTLKSFSHISRTFSISPLSYRSYHSEYKPSGPKLISMPYG